MRRYGRAQSNDTYDGAPASHDWSVAGGVERLVADRHVVGHETPADFAARMDELAERDGAAGLEDRQTIAEDAPPVKEARASAEIRAAVARKRSGQAITALRRVRAAAPARARRAVTEAVLHENRLKSVGAKVEKEHGGQRALELRREKIRSAIENLPLYRRALPYLSLVVLALTALGVFDAAVTKSALNQTALDPVSIWMSTVGIALLFMVLAEAFGLLVALILSEAGHRRRAMYVTGVSVGLLGALVSIAMLGWFRHQAAVKQNQGLSEIVAGHRGGVAFFIDPSFLAPLQAVGCLAAVVVVALYALAGDWRGLRSELVEVDRELAVKAGAIESAEQRVEAIRREGEAALLHGFEIEAEARGAEAEISGLEGQLVATEDAERATGDAMRNRYRGGRNYWQGIYDNGNVRRCAMPTKFGWRRAFTPAPSDVGSGERASRPAGGHDGESLDPDQLNFDWSES
jgi:hypothetical protein